MRRYWCTGLIGLLMVIGLTTACQSSPKPELSGDKDMQELIEMVLNGRPKASLLAREIGPGANPELIKLAGHEDADVRRIAIYCLQETGGEDAAKLMARALLDEDSQVRGAAMKGLYDRPNPAVYPEVLEAFDKSDDSYTRYEIALILGLMGKPEARAALKSRLTKLEDGEIIEGVVTALARMGDPEAQEEFVRRLHASRDESRARYLEHCEYISQPWLVKGLLPILDDLEPMIRIGIDGDDSVIEYLRACDIAINLIGTISEAKFSFELSRVVNYSTDEIEEVRQQLKAHGE